MPQSLANLLVHIVFSDEGSPTVPARSRKPRPHASATWRAFPQRLDCPAIIVGGATDHVHLLGRQSRTVAVADWVKELKRASSLGPKRTARNALRFSGRPATGPSRSASRGANRYNGTSRRKRITIGGCRSRRNCGNCCRNTASNSTSGTFGIDSAVAPTGETLSGLAADCGRPPRVAAARQPWAVLRKPFGLWELILTMGVAGSTLTRRREPTFWSAAIHRRFPSSDSALSATFFEQVDVQHEKRR